MKKSLIFLVLFLFSSVSFAQTGDEGLAGTYLFWGAGARSLGMANAFVGMANDGSAIYWNPAGLSLIKRRELNTFYAFLYEGIGYEYISYVHPLDFKLQLFPYGREEEMREEDLNLGSVGIAFVGLHSGDINRRDENNVDLGNFSNNQTALIFSYGKELIKDFSLGLNLKIIYHQLDSYQGVAAGLDLGSLYKLNVLPVTFGLRIQNLISPKIKLKNTSEEYPMGIRAGLSYQLLTPLVVSFDVDKTGNRGIKFAFGGEYTFNEMIALRFGVNNNEVTSGLGIEYKNMKVDYAFAYHNPGAEYYSLGTSHRFSFNMYWAPVLPVIKRKVDLTYLQRKDVQEAIESAQKTIKEAERNLGVSEEINKSRILLEEAKNLLKKKEYIRAKQLAGQAEMIAYHSWRY